jgi:hypothetical protein
MSLVARCPGHGNRRTCLGMCYRVRASCGMKLSGCQSDNPGVKKLPEMHKALSWQMLKCFTDIWMRTGNYFVGSEFKQ